MADVAPLNYFLVCPPELVSLAQWELKHKAGELVQNISPQKGGLSFQAGPQAVQLNAWLKIPTRILVELAHFKVRDLPRLYKKTRALPWHRELYAFESLPKDGPEWKVSAKRSRLIHTQKIEDTLNQAFKEAIASQALGKPPKNIQGLVPTLYVHLEDDNLTLSVDTSGEALYKRGLKKTSVVGPLRENLASASLMWAFQQLNLKTSTRVQLIDPMAGSGSFALEALGLCTPTFKTREFSYQRLPRFQNLKKLELQNLELPTIEKVLVSDLKSQALKKNMQGFQRAQVLEGDAFLMDFPVKDPGVYRLVICNPPYGERIAKNFNLTQLIQLIQGPLNADGFALLTPRSWDLKGQEKKEGLKLKESLDVKNGGLPTRLWVFGP